MRVKEDNEPHQFVTVEGHAVQIAPSHLEEAAIDMFTGLNSSQN